jgi:hypothetical protein
MAIEQQGARRYMVTMGFTVALVLAGIPAINLGVDPLGYARVAGWRPAFPNEQEASLAAGGAWPAPGGQREAKILNVNYYRPQSALFGSSTVWSYVDSGYAPLRAADGRAAYNFAMPGVSMREMVAAFEHLVALHPPARVVVGLEFFMFSADKAPAPGYFDLPLAQRPTYRRDLNRFVAQRLFTADYTYAAQQQLWFKPAPNFGIGVGAGAREAPAEPVAPPPSARLSRTGWLEKMIEADRLIIAGVYPGAGQPFRFVDDEGWSSLAAMRRMIELARAYDIDLRFYLSPNHARSFEAIKYMGWWPQFETWQRELVSMVEADRVAHPAQSEIPLWDFGGYTSLTTDPVADAPPYSAGYRWYWDGFHFKREVGYMVLDRMFATGAAALPSDFGVRLTADTIGDHLTGMSRAQQQYESTHGDEVDGIITMLKGIGRLQAN